MASIGVHTDVLRSTPIQSRRDSGYGVYEEFRFNINISPIRKKSSDKYNATYNLENIDTSDSGLDKNTNSNIKNVIRKLSFRKWVKIKKTASSEQLDSGIESTIQTADYEIEFDNNSSNLSNQNLLCYLKSFPSDLKSDISKHLKNSSNKFGQPLKYICREDTDPHGCNKLDGCFSLLDENNNVVNISQPKQIPIFAIDFLNALNLRNCLSITSQILSYLDDDDLTKAICVSKNWQCIILSDEKANKRRKNYINAQRNITRGPNKENRFHTKYLVERSHKSAFLSIMNASSVVPQQPLKTDIGKFYSFCQEVKTLQDTDNLRKCPKCSYPSKIESGNKYCCTRKFCQYEFCNKCSSPYLDNHICTESKLDITLPSIIIGSKKSKKYLRRL